MSDKTPRQTGNKLKRFWGKYLFICGTVGIVPATYRMGVIHDDWNLGVFNLILVGSLEAGKEHHAEGEKSATS